LEIRWNLALPDGLAGAGSDGAGNQDDKDADGYTDSGRSSPAIIRPAPAIASEIMRPRTRRSGPPQMLIAVLPATIPSAPIEMIAPALASHFAFSLKADLEAAVGSELEIGLADHEALINLKHSGGALRMTDIADMLVLSRGGITKLVDRLERSGLVQREAAPTDRRVTMVQITDNGLAVVGRSRQILDRVIKERWASKVSDDEARAVLDVIQSVYDGSA
jgi:MarR family 2-MHQ and catechol resistance regulon transcriptional repressor